jgi:hypothetical protein
VIFFVPRGHSGLIVRDAKRTAGERPDIATTEAAIRQAAAANGATLTPSDVAMARAAEATERLDEAMESMRTGGQLQIFNRHYRAARDAARAKGRGFMCYSTAMARLRLALVPYLANGKPLSEASALFAHIFR